MLRLLSTRSLAMVAAVVLVATACSGASPTATPAPATATRAAATATPAAATATPAPATATPAPATATRAPATATPVPATATPASATATATASASATSAGYGFPTVAQDPTSKITVWVDAARSAIAEAFQKDHAECPLNIETYDASAGGSDTFHSKISLLDQAGSGWPDVAWSGQVNDASWNAHRSERRSGLCRAARRGRRSQELARRLHAGRARPCHGRRPYLRRPRQPGARGALVQQDPVRPVRVHHPDHVGGIPGPRRQGRG